jgi:hypothetical protein
LPTATVPATVPATLPTATSNEVAATIPCATVPTVDLPFQEIDVRPRGDSVESFDSDSFATANEFILAAAKGGGLFGEHNETASSFGVPLQGGRKTQDGLFTKTQDGLFTGVPLQGGRKTMDGGGGKPPLPTPSRGPRGSSVAHKNSSGDPTGFVVAFPTPKKRAASPASMRSPAASPAKKRSLAEKPSPELRRSARRGGLCKSSLSVCLLSLLLFLSPLFIVVGLDTY